MKKVHLTREQRYTISAMHKQGCTQKKIAEAIDKDKSVISRELKRNANHRGKYSFEYAQGMAEMRKERLKKPRKMHMCLEKQIIEMIKKGWSPQQISGRLKLENKPFVSHESIYKMIRKDKEEGGTLYKHTRHSMKYRNRPVSKSIPIKNRISIDKRPEIVDAKERLGDWEIDTIIGENNKGAIVTMVERKTAFMMMEKLEHGKNAEELAKVVIRLLFAYKENVHTITSDNGTEFAEHQIIAKRLNTDFFFTNPYASWEKGMIENTNKLIRQYIPKKQILTQLTNNKSKKYKKKSITDQEKI